MESLGGVPCHGGYGGGEGVGLRFAAEFAPWFFLAEVPYDDGAVGGGGG